MVKAATRSERISRTDWIAIGKMRVSPKAQRKFQVSHAEQIASDLDPEAIGLPVVNLRDGYYWVVDGQHRIAALKLCGFGDEQKIQCEVFEGMTEAEEAEMFLRRGERRLTRPFDAFRIGVEAGRSAETDIQRIVQGRGLKISTDGSDKSISAISSLRKVYTLGGGDVLRRTLQIQQTGFAGDLSAFKSELIAGVGRVCQRYNGSLDDAHAVGRLLALQGGAMTLIRKANSYKEKTGRPKDDCVAAAFIDIYNSGRGGKKLDPWWK